jgi:hypothetical protein
MDDAFPSRPARTPWKCAGTCGCVFESMDDPSAHACIDGVVSRLCGPCHLQECQVEGMIDGE